MVRIIVVVLLVIVGGLLVLGWVRTYKTQRSKNQEKFISGTTPSPPPDGTYKGMVTDYKGAWRGKTFFASQNSGINNFQDDATSEELNQRHPFQTSIGKGLRDKEKEVLKIDYNIAGNPFWVRPVLDEIVQTEPDHYLGKIHYRVFPGLSFAVGYFRLEK